jgi:hypothetical protein
VIVFVYNLGLLNFKTMKKIYSFNSVVRRIGVGALVIGVIATTANAQSFTEGFEDITQLVNNGWYSENLSSPAGTTEWFQGNDGVFAAQAGAPTSYIGANFNNTAGTGTISNWLVTPIITFNNGDVISFYTSTGAGSTWPDRLELRLSVNGGSVNVGVLATDVGDYTTLLTSVNPNLTTGGYPETWTQYTVTITGLTGPTQGRAAFRYYVTNGGPSGSNSNYIGIDSFEYTANPAASVDESEIAKTLSIYPNPANQHVTVSFSNDAVDAAQVNILSADGRVVYSLTEGALGNFTKMIDVTGFAKGMYFIQIVSEGKAVNRKLIIN